MTTKVTQNILRVLLGLFMILAGIGHLTFQRIAFQAQVPPWLITDIITAEFIVILSGVIEISFGLALIFIAKYRIQIGILLAIFFILIFPGNISQYVNKIDAFSLDSDGKRLTRLFFQPLLILWALWSTGGLKYLLNKKKQR